MGCIPVVTGAGIRRPDMYTKLHLRMNGTGQNFQELTGKTITVYGNTTQTDTYQKFIGNAGYYDGVEDRVVVSGHSDLNLGTGPFTWEGWVYIPEFTLNLSLGQTIHYYTDGYNGNWTLMIHGTELYIIFASYDGTVYAHAFQSSNNAFSAGNWYYISLEREGTGMDEMFIYRDGVAIASGYVPNSLTDGENGFQFGLDRSYNSNSFYASEWELSVGIARHKGNFTPPTRRK